MVPQVARGVSGRTVSIVLDQTPAPGFYPDPFSPQGRRWWDGRTWRQVEVPPGVQHAGVNVSVRVIGALRVVWGIVFSLPVLGALLTAVSMFSDGPEIADGSQLALLGGALVLLSLLGISVSVVVGGVRLMVMAGRPPLVPPDL